MKSIYFKCIICCGILLSILSNSALAQVDTNVSKKNAKKIVEKEAEFPGGEKALMSFLSTNLLYPKKAIKNDIQGAVKVEFIVCEDGTICDIKVVNNANDLLATEAKRVVSLLPKWKPGTQSGKTVPSYYALPIIFSLEESTRTDRKAERKARKEARRNKD